MILVCIFSLLSILMVSRPAHAIPPEGHEAYTLIGDGKPKSQFFNGAVGYTNPNYLADYTYLQVVGGGLTSSKNYWSFGAMTSANQKSSDRDAYFGRYDFTFGRASLAIKYAHEDWRYIQAGKNTVAVDLNTAFGITKISGLYFTVGGFNRWINYRWNPPSWSPFNLSSSDTQLNLHGIIGLYVGHFLSTEFFTIDINTKDTFSYYNLDNTALDTTWNFGKENFLIRVVAGTRFSGVSGASIDASDFHFTLGIISTH